MADILQIAEGVHQQGSVEVIAYTLDVANGPGSSNPSSIVVTAITSSNNTDVSTTVFPTNSPTSTDNVITLSPLRALTVGDVYHVRVQYTRSGNVYQPYAIVRCDY